MSLITYEPWSLLRQFRDDLDRLASAENDGGITTPGPRWSPAVDIAEFSDRYQLSVDVPGVEPDAIDIKADDGMLTIAGERTLKEGEDRASASRLERGHGTFSRRFELPDTADAEAIKARVEHGVLTVSIPKQTKIEPRRIAVDAA